MTPINTATNKPGTPIKVEGEPGARIFGKVSYEGAGWRGPPAHADERKSAMIQPNEGGLRTECSSSPAGKSLRSPPYPRIRVALMCISRRAAKSFASNSRRPAWQIAHDARMAVPRRLSKSEQRVWQEFPAGTVVDFWPDTNQTDDLADADGWSLDRQVRAEVLVALLCGAVRVEPGHVGRVFLRGVRIIGLLDLREANLQHVLNLEACRVEDGVDLTDATTRTLKLRGCAMGPICVEGANIGGTLDLGGASIEGRNVPTLNAYRVTVNRDLLCGNGFHANGEVRLQGANIAGQLNFQGAHLNGHNGPALNADVLTVTGSMYCDKGFQADGEVRLPGANIAGQLNFQGAHLNGHNGPALNADALTVTGSMYCDKGFQADGEVRLPGANIAGQLNFQGAHLNGHNGPALNADALTVTGSMYCDKGFQADGEVRLPGANIAGQLNFQGAHLNGHNGPALNADALTVTGSMYCDKGFQADGEVRLPGAKIGLLADQKESWPLSLSLDGLTYDALDPYLPAQERLNWLNRSRSYSAQPYRQLAAYYRSLGHDEQARRVLLAALRIRRRQHPWYLRLWGWLEDALAGYGYAPGRATILLTIFFLVGWNFFRAHHPPPVSSVAHQTFNAALYTIEVLIPVPSLGQADQWNPHGIELVLAIGLRSLGWLLAIAVIAAITRTLARD